MNPGDTAKNQVDVTVSSGMVKVKFTPKRLGETGAAEVEINRSRNDDGSVEITVQEKE